VSSSSFIWFALPNEIGHPRLGITVTRKVGGAVVRNRVKRVVRELFRRNRVLIEQPVDLVVHARPSIVGRGTAELEREFVDCARRLFRGSRR
jgi:ribonuclease P protein component